MRTPSVRAASTNPAAAIVLPDAVGWRIRQLVARVRGEVELVVRLVVLVLRLLRVAVAVPVAVRALLVGSDQLGQHPGERIDLVAAELGAGREVGRALRKDALQPEEKR